MTRPYYVMFERQDGFWTIEFGDYERETITFERQCYRDAGIKARDLLIVRLPDDLQATIEAKQRELNS